MRYVHQCSHQDLDVFLELADELGEIGARICDGITLRGRRRGNDLNESQTMQFKLERTLLGGQLVGMPNGPVQRRLQIVRMNRFPDAMQFSKRFRIDFVTWQCRFL